MRADLRQKTGGEEGRRRDREREGERRGKEGRRRGGPSAEWQAAWHTKDDQPCLIYLRVISLVLIASGPAAESGTKEMASPV